jgi:hypothetical protein
VHFIDNFKFVLLTICCEKFPGGTKADDIYTGFVRDIAKYGLDVANCVMVVTDTAANMNKFGKLLEEKLNLDHGFCIDHVFQLTAKLAFKAQTVRREKQTGTYRRGMKLMPCGRHTSLRPC